MRRERGAALGVPLAHDQAAHDQAARQASVQGRRGCRMRLQKNTVLALYSVLDFAARPGELVPASEVAARYD